MGMTQEKMAEMENGLREMSLMSAEDHLLETVQGDYWERLLFFYSQTRGHVFFTTGTIAFVGGLGGLNNWSIPYSDIKQVELCNIGPLIPFFPMGIRIRFLDKKKGKETAYKLGLLNRKKWLAYLEEKVAASAS